MEVSSKSYIIAVILSAIFGVVGIHHLYLGRYVEFLVDFSLFAATIYFWFSGQILWAVITGAIDGLHTFVITIMLLTGSFKDGSGRTICYPGQRIR